MTWASWTENYTLQITETWKENANQENMVENKQTKIKCYILTDTFHKEKKVTWTKLELP